MKLERDQTLKLVAASVSPYSSNLYSCVRRFAYYYCVLSYIIYFTINLFKYCIEMIIFSDKYWLYMNINLCN